MKTRYEFLMHAKCPIDKSTDRYTAILDAAKIIMAEFIRDVALSFRNKEILQEEEVTVELADTFGCTVTVIGEHDGGAACFKVKTTVTHPGRRTPAIDD